MKVLHTEASEGWGGQEIRILAEAEGMRERGHTIIFAAAKGSKIAQKARDRLFTVYELAYSKRHWPRALFQLRKIIKKHSIDIVNTHSSLDSWIAGISAKSLSGVKIIRTRHLSTAIKGGLNGYLLYNALADLVVTTCEEVVGMICERARLGPERCLSIPTGINPKRVGYAEGEDAAFRLKYGIAPDEILVGTACVLRSWKGIPDMLKAAKQLEHLPKLRWVVVGSGPSEQRFKDEHRSLGLGDKFIFTGHLENPFAALGAMDIFLLLSTANEGVSQAALQAAYLKKPLVMTPTGGLKEVCIPDTTGFLVCAGDPNSVAEGVEELYRSSNKRSMMGKNAGSLVEEKFMHDQMLAQMESLYGRLKP